MDTPQTITCVEWCFGYGGNHLGLKRVIPGLRCIAASEIEAYAVANLVAKMEAGFLEPFPVWTDLKTFPCEQFRDLVDIFIASYPCQPFSSSGKRKGADDPRHLWPFVRRAVEIIRPGFCFFENVEGHVSLGLREVLTELALLGYRVENSRGEPTWGIFSAAEAGAPQNRKRVFILGKREGVALGDTLREQIERFYPRGFFDFTGGAGFELGHAEGGRNRAVSTRPRNEGFGATEFDGTSEGVGLANPSGGGFGEGRSELEGRLGKPAPLLCGDVADAPDKQCQGPTRSGDDRSERSSIGLGAASVGDGQAVANRSGCGQDRQSGELRADVLKQSSGDSRGADSREGQEVQSGVGLADSDRERLQGLEFSGALRGRITHQSTGELCSPLYWPGFVARPGRAQQAWEPPRTVKTECGLGGGINGRASNVDRLRLLGNGVYPATAMKAYCELMRGFP